MVRTFRSTPMTSFWRLTSADHSNVFTTIKETLNQLLNGRTLRECLSSLQATRDDQEIEIVLSDESLLSEKPNESMGHQPVGGMNSVRRRRRF